MKTKHENKALSNANCSQQVFHSACYNSYLHSLFLLRIIIPGLIYVFSIVILRPALNIKTTAQWRLKSTYVTVLCCYRQILKQ